MPLPLREAFTARSLGVMWDNYKAWRIYRGRNVYLQGAI